MLAVSTGFSGLPSAETMAFVGAEVVGRQSQRAKTKTISAERGKRMDAATLAPRGGRFQVSRFASSPFFGPWPSSEVFAFHHVACSAMLPSALTRSHFP